jgi:hypothetical protein
MKALIALFIALAAALPARAQSVLGMLGKPADEHVRDILETPYFKALLKNFARSVRKDGAPACLQAKALDDAALVVRGQTLFQRYGVQMMKLLDQGFDRAAYQAALSAAEGPGVMAEMERLKRDDGVTALIALLRPADLAEAADTLVEQFDRYVLIKRIKLDPVGEAEVREFHKDSPTEAMLANPTEATEAAAEQFLDEHQSPAIDRYIHLLGAAETAKQKAIKKEVALKLGPMAYFAGVERDLADLCVGSR